ncbi:MAG: hypothetical protein LAO09_15380 [Acidobacteriia bacterium]|nr:hypothetical protein [Terriglobia bacterium]
MALGQQSGTSATPWREGKPMSPAGQVTEDVAKPAQPLSEIQNFAPYSIALLPDKPDGEVVIPFFTTEDKLAFFTVSQVQQASRDKKLLGRLVSYGELIALIGDLQIQVNQLKQENEKLWAVVGKPSTPQTVVVQPAPMPAPSQGDALTKYLLLRQLFPVSQPYQLPMPTRPNNGLNCTTTYVGSTAYTNCH